jgi:hypothetical protein
MIYEEIHRRLAQAGVELPLPTSRVIHEGQPPAGSAP